MPETLTGVQFAPPPLELQPSITRVIEDAVAHLPKGKRVALVAVVNERGANAAVVARVHGVWEVQTWIGKRWDTGPSYGAAVRAAW